MRIASLLMLIMIIVSACTPRIPGPLPNPTAPAPSPAPLATPSPVPTPQSTADEIPSTGPEQPVPIRAAFYYPWFPQAWRQQGLYPFTQFRPVLGTYQSEDPSVIKKHITAMQYGKIQVGIASWWGPQHHTDTRIPALLKAGEEMNFQWALYVEGESQGDPTPEEIRSTLTYIRDQYAGSPAYAKIEERLLVFVYTDPQDGCAMVSRWKEANTLGAYVVLKVFKGYRACADQPDGWHQYAPAKTKDVQDLYSFTISPGFWKATEEAPRLERSLDQWQTSIRAMNASEARFQLITSFNEWGEGTAIEDAHEWSSPSGFGYYLDALHYDGDIPDSLFPFKERLPTVMQTESESGQVMIGAGDIGHCNGGPEQTAALLASYPDAVIFTVGDNAYPDASAADFRRCFDPTWGKYKDRIRPAPGNHEYETQAAAGYFGYFGAAAGEPGKGYYSYDLAEWHIVVLNSECEEVSGCETDSPQGLWLAADLAAHPTKCTLAYFHHPLFSSGKHGSNGKVRDLWRTLYEAGVDLVVNGHDHYYERFAPQDPDGNPDAQKGIQQIIIGTGGASLYQVGEQQLPNSEKIISGAYGLLQLNLEPEGYQWAFLPVAGETASDQGSSICH